MLKNFKRAYRRTVNQKKYRKRIKEVVAQWFQYSFPSGKNWYTFEKLEPTIAHRLKNHGNFYRRSETRDWYEKLHQKKISYPKDKEIMDQEDIQISQTWFEKFCGSCDKFPGDGVTVEKTNCPFYEKFLKGIYNRETEWEKIGCDDFWD